jgi:serine protease Do
MSAATASPPAPATLLAPVAERLSRSVVQLQSGPGVGAGVVWGPGLVITNAHVIAAQQVGLVLPDGGTLRGRVVAWDQRRDLALIRAPVELPACGTGDPRLRAGALVFAVGHPLGVRQAVCAGVFQALGRLPPGLVLPRLDPRLDWIQADLRLAPGNSGGPIADAEGRVIGVSAMSLGGLALGVPVTEIHAFVKANR